MISRCPDDPAFARLSRLLAGRLAGDDARSAEAHLAQCDVCGHARAELERDHRLLAALGDVPTTAAARAAEIVQRARRTVPLAGRRAVAFVAAAAAVAAIVGIWAPWADRAAIPVPGLHRPKNGSAVPPLPSRPALEAAVAAAAGMPAPELRADAPIVVADGGELVLTMADGRIAVVLDGGSRARLLSEPGRLVMALEAGGVECRVSHRPAGESFVVRASGVEAVVVGTHFRVSAERSEVVVLEGRVEVRRPHRSAERVGPVAGASVPPPSPWLEAGNPCGPEAGRDGGQLTIEGAGRLRIDGRFSLPAPATLRCAPGTLRVEHLGADGHAGRVESVVVRAHERVRLSTATAPRTTPAHGEGGDSAPAADELLPTARRLMEAHQYAEARTALERHLATHEGDMAARYLLGETQRLSGDMGGARASFERVAAGASGLLAGNALNRLALLAERRGPADALAAWDRYLERAPTGPVAAEALLRRANALVALGRRAEARAALQEFLTRFPSHPRRAEVERRLGSTR